MNRSSNVSSNDANFLIESLRGIDNGAGTLIKLRLDGRTPLDIRTLSIKLGEELAANNSSASNNLPSWKRKGLNEGIVELILGQTRVIACVSGEIVKPHSHRPSEGFLSFSVSLSPMAAPNIEANRSNDRSIELGRIIERSIRDSRAIDVESLCIISAEKVWSIKCDVTIIDDCGNLNDAASIAALIALIEYRRPDVTVIGRNVTVHSIDDRQPVSLSLHHWPISLTFAFFDQGQLMLVDPSLIEESVSDSLMTISLNQHSQICSIHKRGGSPITQELFLHCLNITKNKILEIFDFIEKTIQTRDKNRRLARGERIPLIKLGENKNNNLQEEKKLNITEDEEKEISSSEQIIELPEEIANINNEEENKHQEIKNEKIINLNNQGINKEDKKRIKKNNNTSSNQTITNININNNNNDAIMIDDDDNNNDDDDEIIEIKNPSESQQSIKTSSTNTRSKFTLNNSSTSSSNNVSSKGRKR